VSFAAITLRIASERVFIVVYFVIDSVRKLLVIHSYISSSKIAYRVTQTFAWDSQSVSVLKFVYILGVFWKPVPITLDMCFLHPQSTVSLQLKTDLDEILY
jgi:hypothetical protein